MEPCHVATTCHGSHLFLWCQIVGFLKPNLQRNNSSASHFALDPGQPEVTQTMERGKKSSTGNMVISLGFFLRTHTFLPQPSSTSDMGSMPRFSNISASSTASIVPELSKSASSKVPWIATRGSWPYYWSTDATGVSWHRY